MSIKVLIYPCQLHSKMGVAQTVMLCINITPDVVVETGFCKDVGTTVSDFSVLANKSLCISILFSFDRTSVRSSQTM